MTTRLALTETRKAFENNWLSVALGSFLWTLYICLFLLGVCVLGGLLLGLTSSVELVHHQIEEAIVFVATLSAIGPFSAGYVNFLLEVIKHKKCNLNLILSGFNNFGKTFLVGFYCWGISMMSLIVCFGFFFLLHLLLPSAAENSFFRIAAVIISTLVLLYVHLRILWIPYFICYEEGHNLSAWAIVKESWLLMTDNELNLFILLLRFIGWNIVAVLTLGIGWFWVYPYTIGSIYHFYLDLKQQQKSELAEYQSKRVIYPQWSTQKTVTIIFIILFWSFFLCLAFS